MSKAKPKTTVTCIYMGSQIEVPVKAFISEVFGYTLEDKKFIRYSDGAEMFGMSQREFYKLAHDANAVYKRNKMSLVNVEKVMEYMEYFRVFED